MHPERLRAGVWVDGVRALRAVGVAIGVIGCAAHSEPAEFAEACHGDAQCMVTCAAAAEDPRHQHYCQELTRVSETGGAGSGRTRIEGDGDLAEAGPGAQASKRPLPPELLFSRAVRSVVVVKTPTALGSGFVVDAHGLIATNLHVTAGEESISVHTYTGDDLEVQAIAGLDVEHDLVLLRVDKRLPTLALARSNSVTLGEPVIAIGSPLGLEATLSEGLVSGVRALDASFKVLQVTAPISPGSSGGPLINRHGEVVGVATFILLGGSNIGFGVPVRHVKALLQEPKQMSLAAFAAQTHSRQESHLPVVTRDVPVHALSIFDGCSDGDVKRLVAMIGEAIDIGAPLYNDGKFAACAHVYEGATLDAERKLGRACEGPRRALAAGRARAGEKAEDHDRAWALRDAFDGVLDAIRRREEAGPR